MVFSVCVRERVRRRRDVAKNTKRESRVASRQSHIMGSRVHFKLKNALEKQSVTFDGAVIQVGDIKRLIAEQLGTW